MLGFAYRPRCGTRSTFSTDGKWHDNCDDDCPRKAADRWLRRARVRALRYEEASMVNRGNTLTVGWILKAVADGRVRIDMPIGVIFAGLSTVHGIDSFELHTYKDGTQVFVMHTEASHRPVANEPGETCAEVGL